MLGTGFFANVAAGFLSGGIAGQYARLTGLALSGQMSQVGKVLFRPQDLLLDSVLGGVVAGVFYGASILIDGTRSQVTTNAARIPNPNGKLGGPAHQAEISRITTNITNSAGEYVTEFKVNTPGGSKPYRFVDVASIDSNGAPTAFYQVGKATKSNLPIARERSAITDIYEFGEYDVPIIFIPYW